MNRRECLDVDDPMCSTGRPPVADYPRYSSTLTPYSDLMNLDIKVPGEHTLEGESFDAEIQMLHTHLDPDPARVSSIGIPIRATADGYNSEFQELLDQFQLTYDEHELECLLRRGRNLRTGNRQEAGDHHHDDVEDLYGNSTRMDERKLQQSRKFNPYSTAFMPDIFFYRYDGSITEPPCLDITWWVMIDPMIISHDQLHQIKKILFLHMDPSNDCSPTSVHNSEQSVTRPIQPLGEDREIQKCSEGIFVSDERKGRGDGNICR
jgi:carbonic anhydrase